MKQLSVKDLVARIETRESTEKREKKGQDGVKKLIDKFENENKTEKSKLRKIEIGR